MAFLRVVRDKRGYDTTYLIESTMRGSKHESRLLYAFRSPAGVQVGREAFDEGARAALAAAHPDVTFDWPALLADRQVIDASADQRRGRRRPGATGGEQATATSTGARRAAPGADSQQGPRRGDHQPPAPRLQVPSVIGGATPEERMRFLAHWHGILCEQLPVRIQDPARREALMATAQHLNPAGWIDADEIAAGLERAAEALESLSRALSKRRRKARSSRTSTGGPGVQASDAADTASSGALDSFDDEGRSADESNHDHADSSSDEEA